MLRHIRSFWRSVAIMPGNRSVASKGNCSTSKGNSGIPKGNSSMPKVNSSIPQGNSSIPQGSSSIPKGSSSIPKGSSSIPKGNSSMAKGNSSIPKGNSSMAKGNSSIPKGNTSTPNATSTTLKGNASTQKGISGKGPTTTPAMKSSSSLNGNKAKVVAAITGRKPSKKLEESSIRPKSSVSLKTAVDDLAASLSKITLDASPKGDCCTMSPPMSLSEAKNMAPSSPGVYQYVQSSGDATKILYIGSSNKLSRRHNEHLYRDKQVIDQYLKRAEDETSFQFQRCPNLELAKNEESNRLKDFEKEHGRLPPFNLRR